MINIFDNEWIQTKDIVKSIILNQLGKCSNVVYARKCVIQKVSREQTIKFLEQNHIQGFVNSSINIGLFYQDELISLMTFGKSRFNKKYDYELLRFCNRLNTSVVGSFSKCLSYFKSMYNECSIITYADRRYFDGSVYLINGFSLLTESSPNYFYTNDYKTLSSRMEFQKHELKDKLKIYDDELSEWENMQMNGFDRVWDCGNLTYIFNQN